MKTDLAGSKLRAVFDVARRYVGGASSVHELNGAISEALAWAKSSGASSGVLDLLNDWGRMVNRRWNEWGMEKDPISEEQFQTWLREQLVGENP